MNGLGSFLVHTRSSLFFGLFWKVFCTESNEKWVGYTYGISSGENLHLNVAEHKGNESSLGGVGAGTGVFWGEAQHKYTSCTLR